MGLTQEQIRERLANLKNPRRQNSGNQNENIWRPTESDANIRLLQYPFAEDPFVELWFHYGVGKGRNILCPRKMNGKNCPICEFTFELWKTEDEQNKKTARTIGAKQRFYAVVVDRDDSSPVPKYWGFGKTVYGTLLNQLLHPDFSEYLDTTNGRDFIVTTEEKTFEGTGRKYLEATPTPRGVVSKLAETEEEVQKIIGSVKPIDEIFQTMAVSEISERLEEYIKLKENPEEASGEIEITSFDPNKIEASTISEVEAKFNEAKARAEVSA